MLAALPSFTIEPFPVGTPTPKVRSVTPLIDYNGFTGHERSRTWEVVKWLMAGERMPRPATCDLCNSSADQYHAENYFDFATYVSVCRSCHGKVHNRLRNFATFEVRRAEWSKPNTHWVHFLTDQQLPIADWCKAAGVSEPSFTNFVVQTG